MLSGFDGPYAHGYGRDDDDDGDGHESDRFLDQRVPLWQIPLPLSLAS